MMRFNKMHEQALVAVSAGQVLSARSWSIYAECEHCQHIELVRVTLLRSLGEEWWDDAAGEALLQLDLVLGLERCRGCGRPSDA